eukprot:scaffold275543_cov15-Tisochrysis_lutea.AAC.1
MADFNVRALPRILDASAHHKRLYSEKVRSKKVYSFDDWNKHRHAAWRHLRPEPVAFGICEGCQLSIQSGKAKDLRSGLVA